MKTKLSLLLCLVFAALFAQAPHTRIKREYDTTNKLVELTYYDVQGRVTQSFRMHVALGRHAYTYVLDTVARLYAYDSLGLKVSEYGYDVEKGVKTETALKAERRYDAAGRLLSQKNTHHALANQYFTYDGFGNVVKDSTDIIYTTAYEYTGEGLIVKATKYKGEGRQLVSATQFEYDSNNRRIKQDFHDFNNKLTETTTYTYNALGLLVLEETRHFDVYTTPRQRKDKTSSRQYEYDKQGNPIKITDTGLWPQPTVTTFTYEYY